MYTKLKMEDRHFLKDINLLVIMKLKTTEFTLGKANDFIERKFIDTLAKLKTCKKKTNKKVGVLKVILFKEI